jgi:Holliday junction resolvase RusA-like endonuclease
MGCEPLQKAEVVAALEMRQVDVANVKRLVVESFNEQTGAPVALNKAGFLDEADARRLVTWLADCGHLLFREYPFLTTPVHTDVGSKAIRLSQQVCPTCYFSAREGNHVDFAIRIKPESPQSTGMTPARIAAYKEAILSHLKTKTSDFAFGGEARLCVRVIFVLDRKRRADLDNLAKATVDGFQGAVFDNDRQIDHLSLIRLTGDLDEDYVKVHIHQTSLNDGSDVMFAGSLVKLVGGAALNLDDFL